MTIKEAIDYINAHTWSQWKLGLSRTEDLLRLLGNPQNVPCDAVAPVDDPLVSRADIRERPASFRTADTVVKSSDTSSVDLPLHVCDDFSVHLDRARKPCVSGCIIVDCYLQDLLNRADRDPGGDAAEDGDRDGFFCLACRVLRFAQV